jgi:transposase InsO family protein
MANRALLKAIRVAYQASRQTYGSPRIHAELAAKGLRCSENRVARLMRAHEIQAKRKKRRKITTDRNHDYPIAPNLLRQDFTAQAPNQKWLSDLTYIPTAEGWLYLAAVMDVFSRRIVGWALDKCMTSALVTQALQMALDTRQPPAGLIHHSDRGSQYASAPYQALLAEHHLQVSMSHTGNCYDNAPMESFFGSLKTEQVHFQHYQTRAEARTDIFYYIEGFYNRSRRHSTLDYLAPEQFEYTYFATLI